MGQIRKEWETAGETALELDALAGDEGSAEADLERWKSSQQQMDQMLATMRRSASVTNEDVLAELDKASRDTVLLGEAKRALSMQQAVVNVHVEVDNFVRDNIAGK